MEMEERFELGLGLLVWLFALAGLVEFVNWVSSWL